jgi:hypothetical protein
VREEMREGTSNGGLHEFAQTDKLSGLEFRIEPGDVLLRISDERPVRHNGIALRLSCIENEPCTFFAGSHTQQTGPVDLRAVEPSRLPGFEGGGVGAGLDRAAKREHKSIVRTRDLLIDRSVRFQSDFRDRNRHMIPGFGTK